MFVKPPAKKDPLTRMTISMRASTAETLDAYARFVTSVHADAIDRSHLIEQMILAVADKDPDFRRYRSGAVTDTGA